MLFHIKQLSLRDFFFLFKGLRKPLKDQVCSNPILLYQITCHGSGNQIAFPVGQMLSQMHDMEWLTHWLNAWKLQVQEQLQKKKFVIDECVIDESAALIGACVAAFTQDKTTAQYIDRCVHVILHKRGELPTCFVRIDRSHFVKNVHKNIKKGFSNMVRLLRGVMGYLIQCSNRFEFETIMKHVFTLTRNEFISPDVTKAKNMLTKLVATHESDDQESPVDQCEEVEHIERIDISSFKKTCSYRWVMDIYNSVNLTTDKKTENIYHSPSTEKYLIHSFVRCPLWSNIMIHEFESNNSCATSSSVENEFKTVKNLLGYHKRRADLLVKYHLRYLSGQMKLGRAQQNFQTSLQRRRSNSTDAKRKTAKVRSSSLDISLESRNSSGVSDESIQEMPVENWGGWKKKVVNVPKRRSVNSILSPHDPEYFQTAKKWVPIVGNLYGAHLCI